METEYKPNCANTSIIIPVHNALADVQNCIASLKESDAGECRLYLIDDGSDMPTADYVQSLTGIAEIIRHEEARGYTVSINEALKLDNSKFIVIANSDLIFPKNWFTRLARCLVHAPGIGIVGPLGNAASYQSVPFVHDRWGGFKINELPWDMTVDDFNEFIFQHSRHFYPGMNLANGFCMMLKREVVERINYFDEENFPLGYGEEDDFCYRASCVGYRIHCADDVYVYHAKSRSFGAQRRLDLIKEAGARLARKYPDGSFAKYIAENKNKLESVRVHIINALISSYISSS